MPYKGQLTFEDIEIGTIIKITYIDGYPMKEQNGRFLGIMGNKNVMKEYENKEGWVKDGFGILVEPLDGQITLSPDGKVIPFMLFPHTIKKLDCYDNDEEYFKLSKTKDNKEKLEE